MELTVKERLLVSTLYPKESDILTQIIIKTVNDKVNITQEEAEAIELKSTPEGFSWNQEKASVKEINFETSELSFLQDRVAETDRAKKVTSSILSLFLKIKKA